MMYGYEVTITNRIMLLFSTLFTVFTIGLMMFLYPLFQFIHGWYQFFLNVFLFLLFIAMIKVQKRSKAGKVVMIINEKGFFDQLSSDAEQDKIVVWKNVKDMTLQEHNNESIIIVQLLEPKKLFKAKPSYLKDDCIHLKLPKHIGVEPKELLRVMQHYKKYYELYIEDKEEEKEKKKHKKNKSEN
ncbi:hypothetical protein [Macrococcus armenti]|uniref:hypothetical protein n=1 Tax=Macrococcus armenti TaxID=2875764 RepID=UPI001CCD3EF9|nr:hypothetical protein [Macrococcus armenti]UBH15637.1 hypothetical protein LAU44_01385 [Macrococcus armenti]UBH17998.1 hypothetical protein LAU39_01390 [Macrococcus armenti]UBH20263.1 hypothetical protein LAU40_01385 [Macrococcus armenti]